MTRDLPFAEVSRLLKPDFDTGRLFWLERTPDMFTSGAQTAEHNCRWWNSRFAGKEAFTPINSNGYRTGCIYGKIYQAHRVVWLLATGSWPANQIDHINGDTLDNSISNLRQVTNSQNAKNQKTRVNNTSGFRGVYQRKGATNWHAKIVKNGKAVSLGNFDRFEDAVAARKSAEADNGYHPNHGRSA